MLRVRVCVYAHAECLAQSCSRFSPYHQLRLEVAKAEMRKVLYEFVVVFVYYLYSVGEIVMDSWLWGSLVPRPEKRLALGLAAGKAAYEAGIQVPTSAV